MEASEPIVPSLYGLLWRLAQFVLLGWCLWLVQSQNQLIRKQNGIMQKQNGIIQRQNEALKFCVGQGTGTGD